MFTKSDLRNGDIILRRDGHVSIAIADLGVFVSPFGFMPFHKTNEDLTDHEGDSEWDIVAVRRPVNKHDCQFTAFKHNLGELVYDRERDTKKPLYNCKVVCIDICNNIDVYTVGKIYQFKDGVLCGDDGVYYPCNPGGKKIIHSFDEWCKWTTAKFIEIVE
jgi:hypothetical protein